jgi:hypothetical protein
MHLQNFSRFIQFAPALLERLLASAGRPADGTVVDQVRNYYGRLALDDFAAYDRNGGLRPARALELAQAVGLPTADATLPIQLYQSYHSSLRDALAHEQGYRIPVEEIVYGLTGGTVPLDLCFVVGNMIYSWEPQHGGVCFHRISDNVQFEECKRFLLGRGLRYASLAEVLALARDQKWPGWQTFADSQEGKVLLEKLGVSPS